jgi:cellulose synthase operon protein C
MSPKITAPRPITSCGSAAWPRSSGVRPAAEYDAAAALIQLKEWDAAARAGGLPRDIFPGHPLQPEVTKKMAFVYKENGQLSLAADEYERIETESQTRLIRRDALLVAADLHEEDGNKARALEVYRRYADYFPSRWNSTSRRAIKPPRSSKRRTTANLIWMNSARSSPSRLPRAAAQPPHPLPGRQAALVLAEPKFAAFTAVKLAKPFEANLRKKRDLMKAATQDPSQTRGL